MTSSTSSSLAVACVALLATAAAIAQGPPPSPVFVRPAQHRELAELRPVVGNLRAVQRAEVASIEAGRVADVLIEVGTEVSAGQVLVRLDARRLKLSLAEAEASVEAWSETVRERQAGLARFEADLESIETARSESPGAVSQQQLRAARTEVEQARARLEGARREATQAELRRDLLQVRLDDMEIRAPFDGEVVARNADPGEWLAAGGSVATLVSTGVHEAWIEVDERFDFATIAALDQLRVRVDATGERFDSRRVRLVRDVDPRSRRATLIADLEPNGHMLAPGLSVTAQVPTGRTSERLVLPSDALVRDSGGGFVYVVRPGAGGQPIAMPVNIQLLYGLDAETVVCEAATPIADGESIIVEGNERLRPFSPVAPKPAPEPEQQPREGERR